MGFFAGFWMAGSLAICIWYIIESPRIYTCVQAVIALYATLEFLLMFIGWRLNNTKQLSLKEKKNKLADSPSAADKPKDQ